MTEGVREQYETAWFLEGVFRCRKSRRHLQTRLGCYAAAASTGKRQRSAPCQPANWSGAVDALARPARAARGPAATFAGSLARLRSALLRLHQQRLIEPRRHDATTKERRTISRLPSWMMLVPLSFSHLRAPRVFVVHTVSASPRNACRFRPW